MTRSIGMAALAVLVLVPIALSAQVPPVRVEEDADCRWEQSSRDRYCEVREYALEVRDRLAVDAGGNGGISVVGWDRDEVRLVARVHAWSDDGDPRDLAGRIEVRTGDVIEPIGPRSRNREGWSVSLELRVPRDTDLRLEAHNGGISLADLRGAVDAATTNGGISLRGGAGSVRGETRNGGIRVELTGGEWRGDGVDLRTTNGGVRILVPEGYSADLETGTVNGGMQIEIPIMVQGRIDRILRTELGGGGALIRARTTNGGVVIRRG